MPTVRPDGRRATSSGGGDCPSGSPERSSRRWQHATGLPRERAA